MFSTEYNEISIYCKVSIKMSNDCNYIMTIITVSESIVIFLLICNSQKKIAYNEKWFLYRKGTLYERDVTSSRFLDFSSTVAVKLL